MRKVKYIQVFEHQRLLVGEYGFKQKHLDALLKLNECHDFSYFDPIYCGIKFKQYVGVIQVDGLCIEILPKIDKNTGDSRWQSVLIQMLKACGKLKPDSVGSAHVNRQHFNLLAIYFDLYLIEINGLIHKGLTKQYRKNTGQVKALKGKIEFAGQIRKNLVHHERFYTTHQVYDQDHLLHQVLYVALNIVGYFTKGTWLYDKFKRAQLEYPEVKEIKVTEQLINSIRLNRKTASYNYALELARLIILNYSPDITAGKDKMLSLLFDMNQLWEEYVLVKLKEALKYSEFIVTGQETKPFWNYNYLQPDIVIRNKVTQETFVIDTKWKQPNGSVSIDDLRQIYSYCRFWEAEKAMLLYPGLFDDHGFKDFMDKDQKCSCKIAFVDVLDVNGSLDISIAENIMKQIFNN